MPVSESIEDDYSWPQLLEAARVGNEQALNLICKQLRGYLLRIAEGGLNEDLRRKMGASDIVQESLLEVQNDLSMFNGTSETEFRAWTRRLVQHNLLDNARKYKGTQSRDTSREISIEKNDEPINLASPQRTASSIYCKREADEELIQVIEKLPENQRRVLELRHRKELPYKEIASQLNITAGAAAKLFARAIESLRQSLAQGNNNE